MDLNLSTDELAFRDEVRHWIRTHLPEDLRRKVVDGHDLGREDLLSWHRILARKGWIAPAWPEDWGGTNWSLTQRYVFEQECGLAGAPMLVAFGVVMCADGGQRTLQRGFADAEGLEHQPLRDGQALDGGFAGDHGGQALCDDDGRAL